MQMCKCANENKMRREGRRGGGGLTMDKINIRYIIQYFTSPCSHHKKKHIEILYISIRNLLIAKMIWVYFITACYICKVKFYLLCSIQNHIWLVKSHCV